MVIKLLLGLLGIVLYTFTSAGITFAGKGFDIKEMFKNNLPVWLVSLAVLLVVIVVLQFSPESAQFLGDQLGLDIVKYSENYLTFGFVITPIIKAFQNRTQNK